MLDELYKVLLQERNNDASRFWTVFSLLSVLNIGLLAAVLTKSPSTPVQVGTAILGILLCFLWFAALRRLHFWLGWWEEKLVAVEPSFLLYVREDAGGAAAKSLASDFCIFCGRDAVRKKGISTRKVGWLLPLFFALAWLLIIYSAFGERS